MSSASISLVYLPGKCLALMVSKAYSDYFFYTSEDEIIPASKSQKYVYLERFIDDYGYSEHRWYYNESAVKNEYEHVAGLLENVEISAGSVKDDYLVLKVIDPEYRTVLKKLKDKKDAAGRKSKAPAGRTSRSYYQPVEPVTVEIPDPDDPDSWVISVSTNMGGLNNKKPCLCQTEPCRHTMAAAEFLRREKGRLKDAYIRSSNVKDKSLFISEAMEDMIFKSKVRNTYVNDISPENTGLLKKMIGEITSVNSKSYFDAVLNFIFHMDPDGWDSYQARLLESFIPMIGAFYMEPFTRDLLLDDPDKPDSFLPLYPDRQTKSNVVTFKREFKHFQNAEKDFQKGKTDSFPYKEIMMKYSDDGMSLLKYYADVKNTLSDNDLKFIKMYSEQYNRSSDDIKKHILEKIDLTDADDEDFKNALTYRLLQAFSPEDQAVLLSQMENYDLSLASYSSLSQELKEQLAEKMPPEKDVLTYIFENVAVSYSDEKMADLILKMAEKLAIHFHQEEAELLINAALKLKNNSLLVLYLADRYNIADYLPKHGEANITKDDIKSYFTSDFLIDEYDKKIRVNYFLFAAGSKPAPGNAGINETIVEYTRVSVFHFFESQETIHASFRPESFLSGKSLKLISETVLEGRLDEFERKKQDMQDAIDASEFESKNKRFAELYKKLCGALQEEKVILTDTFKVRLSYLLNISDQDILLSFKIGNTRDYVVKNALDFLKAFRIGETVTYGKDLVFTHDISNLSEDDIPVMRALTSMTFRPYGSGPTAKRYINITGPVFSNIIELLRGRNICFDDEPALVRLNPVDIKIKINDKYELKVDFDPSKQTIIFSGTKCYIYTNEKSGISTIDCVSADADKLHLIEFALEGGKVSIRPILNDFKRNIYSRFYDSFDVSNKIKDSFNLSVIRINAYFDYADKAITVRNEYLKDDKPVSKSAVTERMDVAKVDNFDTALVGLGFEDSVLRDEGKILSFLKMDFTNLKRMASIYLSDRLSNKKLVSVNRQTIRISCTKSGLIDAVLDRSDFSEDELAEILLAMKRKRKYILLSDDRIIDLDSQEAKDFRDTVNDLGLEAGHLYKKKRLSMVGALKAFAHENSCSIDKQLRTIVDEIRDFKDFDAKIPALTYKMRGYQEEGYRWLSVLSKYGMGGILADDMGLGKTLQIIALIKADKTQKPSLIVCPKSLVFNWVNEFSRFDGETGVTEIYGPSDKRADIIGRIDYNSKKVYVTSYDSLRNDISDYSGTFNYCVLDEAQYIKNVTALKSKSVKEINADHRFALTGTPIENNIIDLWSIFDFIMPGYFDELSEFKSSASQEGFHEKIARRIGPFVLRRIKENVLADLPAKYETVLSCEMNTTQRKYYEALRKKARDTMNETGKAFDLLPMLMQMRQVCVDPSMCIDNYTGGSGKMDMLNELIPDYLQKGHRILLFSQFVKGLNRVEMLLKEQGISYYMLTGDTPAKERSRMIDEFNSTTGTDVFLISLKAGGTGLNLTGADTVIHLDPWWNVAAENQATDRAHRIGQTKNVEVIKLISEESIEQRVIELQNQKKDLIDKVISNDDSSVTGASLEDIAYILD